MVNKKGYLRTLEAVVAVLIIFGFMLFIFPKTERIEGQMPLELERMANAMLEEIENNDQFRKCVLADPNDVDAIQDSAGNFMSGPKCVNGFIQVSMPPLSFWTYAFTISDEDGQWYYQETDERENPVELGVDGFNNDVIPDDKSVFTKSVFVSVDDVSALPLESEGAALSEYRTFKIYFWEK